MSHPRVMRPMMLGTSSRLLLEQFVSSASFSMARSSGKQQQQLLMRAATASVRRSQLICLGCGSFNSNSKLRFSTSSTKNNTEPPKPSNAVDSVSSPELPHPEPATKLPTSETQPPNPSTLPSHTESRRSHLSQRFNSFMDRAQATVFTASQQLNDLTGYSGIETLKSQIAALEHNLSAAQTRLHAARTAHKERAGQRSAVQRETTSLLARQKTWTPQDFERFTALYRQDYELEAEVGSCARELEEAEMEAERLGRELNAGILARYHEEQIWSDKIRRMSTWGTWGLMGVNVLLFLVFQFGAEPWRRARLVRGFEEKVRAAIEEERERDRAQRIEERSRDAIPVAGVAVGEVEEKVSAAEASPATETASKHADLAGETLDTEEEHQPAISWKEALRDPAWWKTTAVDLTSDRKIAVRMRDVSLIALEGVVAGAAVAGTLAVFIVRRP